MGSAEDAIRELRRVDPLEAISANPQRRATSQGQCERCGLVHGPEELFVQTGADDDGSPVLDETCELDPAWRKAHSHDQPLGAVAFHTTREPDRVLRSGLDPARGKGPCKHVCLAARAEVAAGLDIGGSVLRVDISGLDLFFELGEARHHRGIIEAARLSLLVPQPDGDSTVWSDPAWRRNHTDCLSVNGFPFSRRLLRAAAAEANRRWEGYDLDAFKSVVTELQARLSK